MNARTSSKVFTALVLALVAGTISPALAQVRPGASRETATNTPNADYRASKWMSDRKVINNNGEDIANVSDLIIDRGSGRIEFIVVKTGSVLGMGGRAVAIPYSAFTWEAGAKDRFVLASTPEQLKTYPEYSAESWNAMRDGMKDDKNTMGQRLGGDNTSPNDPYAGNIDVARTTRVTGTITKVERVRTSTFGEQVILSVETAEGTTRRVALGPSWYVNATPAAPMRGDKVTIDALALPRDPDGLLAGTEVRAGDRTLRLRDSSGSPAWALKTVESDGRSYSTPYSRYLRANQITGMKIDCRGVEAGKVNDIIIDRNSGEIAFLSIDPNQNFLGIGDTRRLVPWSVATLRLDGTMGIDASKEMVLASTETPSDLSTLSSNTNLDGVYKAFNVPTPRFESSPNSTVGLPDAERAWSANGLIMSAADHQTIKIVEGRVIQTTDVKFANGFQSARAVRITLPGDAGEELVLLGPALYMDNQKLLFKNGDQIKVEACPTTIDGRRYWLARSIDSNDSRTVLIDGKGSAVWAQR